MKRVIPVLCWVEVKVHTHRPHGCLHENGKIYTPFWARGREAMKKEAEVKARTEEFERKRRQLGHGAQKA